MKAKDPENRSRLSRAAAVSALCSGFVGAMVFFENGMPYSRLMAEQRAMIAMTGTMVMFWLFFLPLYVFTVHKSRKTIEFEHQARLEEQRRVVRTKAALKPGGEVRDLKADQRP